MIDAPDIYRRMAEVAHAEAAGFGELVRVAGLDPEHDFRHTLLTCDLRDEDLNAFDFSGARLRCDLRGADLTLTRGVTAEMLRSARWDVTTKLPSALFWTDGQAPSWAEDWGRDSFGPWVVFPVPGTDVIQRMRWCPPGGFKMGSPDRDEDSFPCERPQHDVGFAQGYWMFDTAVTKALWAAAMPLSPRKPRGARLPKTKVNWHEAQEFISRLNDLLPGLELSLPSEAAWEYACRAGTATQYSFGNRVTRKQVCFDSRSPVPAASLPANPWGFYEMHGNVWGVWTTTMIATMGLPTTAARG